MGFGQQRCLPNAPKCRGCLNEDICPSSKLKDGGPWGRKKRPVKRELLEPVKRELLEPVKRELLEPVKRELLETSQERAARASQD